MTATAAPAPLDVVHATLAPLRGAVQALLRSRYRHRGLGAAPLPAAGEAGRMTLAVRCDEQVLGTISVLFDGPRGLHADATFPHELAALRARGRRLCEFGRLAVQTDGGSHRTLAALLRAAHAAAMQAGAADTAVMEVHPRHVRFYERMAGATVQAAGGWNGTVQAPSVLMAVSLDDARRRIAAGGRRCRVQRALAQSGCSPWLRA